MLLQIWALKKLLALIAFSALLLVPAVAQDAFAIPITDASQIPEPSKTVDFSQFSGGFTFTAGPVQIGDLVGEDITWSSTSSASVIGDGPFDLALNGFWTAARNGYVGNGLDTSSMRFDFNSGTVSAVGGFVNYSPADATSFTITALDSNDNVLETFDVDADAPITTPDAPNDGAFRGIKRVTSDISAITLLGQFNVLDDLKFSPIISPAVGGELIPLDTSALLLTGAQMNAAWMIPVIVSAIGIGIVIARKF